MKPITNLSLFVGPQIGFNVYRSASMEGLSISGSTLDNVLASGGVEIKTIDIAAAIGVQYAFMGKYLVSARYNIGFTPTVDYTKQLRDTGAKITGGANRVIQISVGYQF